MHTMASTDELIQNIIETMDNAHSQRMGLSELLDSLQQAKDQITESASRSKDEVHKHFEALRTSLCDRLSARMDSLICEIDTVASSSLEPLIQCEDMINEAMSAAVDVMEDGKNILGSRPEDNVDALLKFNDSPNTKNLNMLPQVPSLHEVPYISADFPDNLNDQIQSLVSVEGRIFARPPVQVTDTEERPGALLITWEETDEDMEVAEFCLQYCFGAVQPGDQASRTFHTAYTGPCTSHLVKHLRQNTYYSFRVSCRPDVESNWCMWSVPRQAMTNIPHYQWCDSTEGYCTSNENKTGTRVTGLTRVLYSESQCYTAGHRISFKVMDTGEKSPMDGLAIAVTNDDIDTLKRLGAVFLGTDGAVYIDGQEMKTKLPNLSRNSLVTIETISLTNGKVRMSVQVEEKELTFDWTIDRQVTLGVIGGMGMKSPDTNSQKFFFAMQFSHEDWKIGVE